MKSLPTIYLVSDEGEEYEVKNTIIRFFWNRINNVLSGSESIKL